MSGKPCALPSCSKACTSVEHLACGELHHLLLMAGRYNPAHPQPYQVIRDRNDTGYCALPSCSKALWPGHPWCSREHHLSWISSFYASLSPLQICKLPGCTRHVYVSDTDDVPPSQFCGWRHCQKFAMLSGLQQQEQYQPSSTQRECGHVPSMKSLMHAFQHFALHGVTPQSIKVDYEFFSKHPWEVLAEGDSCCLIVQCKFSRTRKTKQRDMVTKDHYHWKQQGPPKEKSGYCKRYFSYRKRKGKLEESVKYHVGSSYTMKEYILTDVESYSLVKICCKGGKKICKGRSYRKQDNTMRCSQDSVTSKLDPSNFQVFENLEELFCIDDFLEDLPSSSISVSS